MNSHTAEVEIMFPQMVMFATAALLTSSSAAMKSVGHGIYDIVIR